MNFPDPGAVMKEAAQLLCGEEREAKMNESVGDRISGILYKWVNLGKRWRRRWFVLEDGVLSYYKIHGHHKIDLNLETEKRSTVLGEDSLRLISPRHNHNIIINGTSQLRPKPVGQVHLKVSSIRESRSDDKRFLIFTGSKRLHLRAETREDRVAWIDALQAIKDLFPRVSNSELMAPVDNVVVSTEKLRQLLLEEGVSEAAIQDSEQIMRNEFAALQNQLMLLKEKHWLLLDSLRQLEVHVMISRKNLANRIRNSSSVSSAQNHVHPSSSEILQINSPSASSAQNCVHPSASETPPN
ncbi:hypothetical protein HYC85_007783 [Camellia sinensis]|uniref:PH domain-containing protein n=1 Tax=Camellia sinensis TaxID=4442 RepID=A0A7J7HRA8_CAMSI|nr:hypothetical protein HYC85_007783 [Camellia sinensis]